MLQFIQQVGKVMTGVVTRLVPLGAFVRIEDRAGGLEGLVHITELAEGRVDRPGDVVQVGDTLPVKVIEVDPPRRRITLSHLQALTAEEG